MITIPVYDLLILPGVTFYFKKDAAEKWDMKPEKEGDEVLFLFEKEEKPIRELAAEDFYPYGVLGEIDQLDSDGTVRVRAKERVAVSDFEQQDGSVFASAVQAPEADDLPEEEEKQRFQMMKNSLLGFVQEFPWGAWARGLIMQWKSFEDVVCAMSNYLSMSWEEKYEILASDSHRERCDKMEAALYEFIEFVRVGNAAESEQKETHESAYRESAIKKQIEYLQRQLDDMHPENITDVRRFEKKIRESGMNEEAKKEAEKVLNRMKQEGKDGHEYGMLYDYLDFVTSLAWKTEAMKDVDLVEAEKILDEDHYGLKKVKERIIEQLAVMQLNRKQSGSILLFVGAPGTGKTSIGQSIARALGREYIRISLGGVRDEAEIRGHRRTYVGAMPGRIMEGMKRAGTQNPVMVLDEVDKLVRDYNGDPSSALLEVLDPEQNSTFTDHYMNVPYDLSNVFFVCTANSTDTIPEPLLNRMEVIRFSGYTEEEKFQIARKHLLPKTMKSMGLKSQELKLTDEALHAIITGYTAESGVRGLKRQMDVLCRHAAVKLVKGEQKSFRVSEKHLEEFLGRPPILHEKLGKTSRPGIVTGLAWTQAGGEILFIETMFTKGSGKLQITGQLGDVMKESAQIAVTLVKNRYPESEELFRENDLHIHVPAGATPKDGPSAGITLVTALSSLVTGKQVRPELGMTGEVSLRGDVMPIGGLPEKLMAAQRAGVKTVLIPVDNKKDLEDIAEEVKQKLEIIPVATIEETLNLALEDPEV